MAEEVRLHDEVKWLHNEHELVVNFQELNGASFGVCATDINLSSINLSFDISHETLQHGLSSRRRESVAMMNFFPLLLSVYFSDFSFWD